MLTGENKHKRKIFIYNPNPDKEDRIWILPGEEEEEQEEENGGDDNGRQTDVQ